MTQGKWNAAVAEYKTAIALDPKDVKNHIGLGLALASKGKQNEAIDEYNKAIALDPKYAKRL